MYSVYKHLHIFDIFSMFTLYVDNTEVKLENHASEFLL
jgi:hypothetical protein